MDLKIKLLFVTSYIAFFIKESTRIDGKLIKLRNGIGKGICTYSHNYVKSSKIQPPLKDPTLFTENNKEKCDFLQWKFCGTAGSKDCLKFKCALPSEKRAFLESGKSTRVVGGTVTKPHEFPHMVSIFLELTHRHACGGTIINEYTMVTARHCIGNGLGVEEYHVFAGKHNLSTEESSQQQPVLKSITIHEGYEGLGFQHNDIALIEFASPLKWTPEVQPALLPSPDFVPSGDFILTGWGLRRQEDDFSDRPDVPSKVTVANVPLEECRQAYANDTRKIIRDTHICAGKVGVAEKGACHGDSGGPLGFLLPNGSFVLIGIDSAAKGCGDPRYPDIYTDVSKYITWIHDNIKPMC